MKILNILERLKGPVPDVLISSKDIKGNRIEYISWVNLIDLLNERAGLTGWSWRLIDQTQAGTRLVQVWELEIIGDDGKIARQSSGDEAVDLDLYGTTATNIEAQCLRRCCSKFGLGLDLWRKKASRSSSGAKPRVYK